MAPRSALFSLLTLCTAMHACTSFSDLEDPSNAMAGSGGSNAQNPAAGAPNPGGTGSASSAGTSGSDVHGGSAGEESSAAGNGGSGKPEPVDTCDSDDDCTQPVDPCRTNSCLASGSSGHRSCIEQPKDAEFQPTQQPGDCLTLTCSNGTLSKSPSPDDLPVPLGACDAVSCTDDTPSHADDDTLCDNLQVCVAGSCICAPCPVGEVADLDAGSCLMVPKTVLLLPTLVSTDSTLKNVADGSTSTSWVFNNEGSIFLTKSTGLRLNFDTAVWMTSVTIRISPAKTPKPTFKTNFRLQVNTESALPAVTVDAAYTGDVHIPLPAATAVTQLTIRIEAATNKLNIHEIAYQQCATPSTTVDPIAP